MLYNWQRPHWPNFTYELTDIQAELYHYTEAVGRLSGRLSHLSKVDQQQSAIEVMVSEALKTSEIEGEYLQREDVVSSIRNALGFNKPVHEVHDTRAEGISRLMVKTRETFSSAVTAEMLFDWHRDLFFKHVPSAMHRITIGAWRTHTAPMQVVSGTYGQMKVHFEAPPSSMVPLEMNRFVDWFNQTAPGQSSELIHGPVRSAIAHLHFESIHPFDDGNGRIGRAIAEKALAQSLGYVVPFSLSVAIERKKKQYYDALKAAQADLNITSWIHYFVRMLLEAQEHMDKQIQFTIQKTQFFDRFKSQMNDRQLKVLERMLKEGMQGFQGGMNTQKYAKIADCSTATATRDLGNLLEKQILKKQAAGGRSTRYDVNLSHA